LKLSLYESVIRRTMFCAQPETAHGLAKWFFRRRFLWKTISSRLHVTDVRLHAKLGNLELPNPVGLAAGFDKNCEMMDSLFRSGFGYLILGTITLNPREGNPKPRIWRTPPNALINSMGLPNRGAEAVAPNLAKRQPHSGPVIVSISGLNVEDFAECHRLMEPLADGVELNISTPNTAGVRIFQNPETLSTLLKRIDESRDPRKALWVKLPPHNDEERRKNVHRLIDVCGKSTVQGLTCANTQLVNEPRASIGTGGLSGPPIFNDMLRMVADTYQYTAGRIPINACGGISSGADAWNALQAGASSIQMYTALVYHGPGIVSRINRELLRRLTEANLRSINEITPKGVNQEILKGT